jgi:adenylate cyclase
VSIALAVALSIGALGVGAHQIGLLERLELSVVDALFEVRERDERDVVLVGIDQPTLTELKVRPPLRRTEHARVIRRLHAARPKAIAYDVQFTEPSEAPHEGDDLALADALHAARHTPIALATADVAPGGEHQVMGGNDALRELGARAGHAIVVGESDGVVRRLRRGADGLDSLAVAAVEDATGRPVDDGLFAPDGTAWIDFAGPPGRIPTYSFIDVAEGRVPAAAFRGKVVVVGATASTFQDLHATATSGRVPMSGPELQANAIATLLHGARLRPAPGWAAPLVVLLAALAGAFGITTLRRARRHAALGLLAGLAVSLSLLALLLAAIVGAFKGGVILPATYSLAAFGLAFMLTSALLLSWDANERKRQRQRDAFARFVPEQALDEVLERASGDTGLRGVERDATVLFADLRGFTGRSESKSAQDVIEFLNRYLGEMSEALIAHGGTVVSYMGDGIMAVFGAPVAQPDHAERALAAATEMATARLDRFNAWLQEEGHEDPCRLSIGLHSGPVASGTVGSERRLEYAAVGDTTNVAARLEQMTRQAGHDVLVSDETRRRAGAGAGALALTEVGTLPVRGLQRAIAVWALDVRGGAPALAA